MLDDRPTEMSGGKVAPGNRHRRPGAGSMALGLVLLSAAVGVAVVHLLVAPTAFLLQRRARRGGDGDSSTTRS